MRNIVFIPHGGGPLPLLGDTNHQQMITALQNVVTKIEKPDAILLISAHWEESVVTITASAKPELIYDYYNFPPESYQIEYDCVGEPELAQQVFQALDQAGIESKLDSERGFDHGMFVPLKLMYPQADIPCVQLSLVNNLDANLHIRIGQALAQLEYKNLLVIGSGFSFHNMQAFFSDKEGNEQNLAFEAWLQETIDSPALSEQQRVEALVNWHQAPSARYCHPREEHLLPLHVCYGMANQPTFYAAEVQLLNKSASLFHWRRAD